MKEILIKILDFLGLAFWIEISTDIPRCTYYFGPFLTKNEARLLQDGYIEDLLNEDAKGLKVSIKRLKATELTIFDESVDKNSSNNFFLLNSQPSLN